MKSLAHDPLLHWGNHTRSHAILTNYPPDEIREEVRAAAEDILAMTGRPALSLAYPSGAFSRTVQAAVQETGVAMCLTTRPGKNRLPLTPASRLQLRRFSVKGNRDVAEQCELICSSLAPFSRALAGLKRLRDGY